MNRRGFLKALSAAPVVAPYAAENVAKTMATRAGLVAAGVSTVGVPIAGGQGETARKHVEFLRKILGLGIPRWMRAEHRQRATYDWPNAAPEVLSFRSCSDIGKRVIGISRAERKYAEEVELRAALNAERIAFCEKEGWWW